MWWIATGTYDKMRSDVQNKYNNGYAYWIPKLMQGELPLEINHILLSLLVLGFGLILSKMIFLCELLYNLYVKRVVRKAVSFTQVKERKSAIDIGTDPSQSLVNISDNSRNLESEIRIISSDLAEG